MEQDPWPVPGAGTPRAAGPTSRWQPPPPPPPTHPSRPRPLDRPDPNLGHVAQLKPQPKPLNHNWSEFNNGHYVTKLRAPTKSSPSLKPQPDPCQWFQCPVPLYPMYPLPTATTTETTLEDHDALNYILPARSIFSADERVISLTYQKHSSMHAPFFFSHENQLYEGPEFKSGRRVVKKSLIGIYYRPCGKFNVGQNRRTKATGWILWTDSLPPPPPSNYPLTYWLLGSM